MIEAYVNDDAIRAARQNVLFVPVPVGATDIEEGFAGQVFRRFPLAEVRLSDHKGLDPSEVLLVGHLGAERQWAGYYSLALCGIHFREPEGWGKSDHLMKRGLDSLSSLTAKAEKLTVATAGIPGTGYSGLRGGANPEVMRAVLEEHVLHFTVYQDGNAGDRAKLLEATPPKHDVADIDEPTYA